MSRGLFLQQAPNAPVADIPRATTPTMMTMRAKAFSKSPSVNPGPIPISFNNGKISSSTVLLFSRNSPPPTIKASPRI